MNRIAVLPDLKPASHRRSGLHADDLVWVEKNCYVDVWIEVVHALRLDPFAMLPFVVAVDFEGDQWTFFKPPHDELRHLYGLDVQELNIWRPLIDHVIEHVAAGKMLSTEADAYWLPDTAGTDYRTGHSKTTIVIQAIEPERQRLGYFHNCGYHELAGEDFSQLFQLDQARDPERLPLYAELIRTDRLVYRPRQELAAISLENLRRHLARLPTANPIVRFGERFTRDLAWVQARGLDSFHAWAFASVRQLGAAFELAALYLKWLGETGSAEFEPAIEPFDKIAVSSKTVLLKAARAVNARRDLDARALFTDMSDAWERGMTILARG